MRTGKRSCVVALLLIAAMAFQGTAADRTRVVRSCIFPGMGQLGDEQTARGLLYMAGEATLLSLMVVNISKMASYNRHTEYLKVYYEKASTTEEREKYYDLWQQRLDEDVPNSQTLAIVFGAGAAVWWAWNIVDGIFFGPRDKERALLLEKIRENTTLSLNTEKASIVYTFSY